MLCKVVFITLFLTNQGSMNQGSHWCCHKINFCGNTNELIFAFFPIKNTHIYTVEPSRSRPCDFHRVSLIQASKGQLTDFVAMRHRVRWSTLGMETQIRRKDDGISGTYENNKHFFNVEGSPGRFPLCNYIIFLRFQLLGINDLPQSNFAVTQTACFCLTTIIKSLPMHFFL